MNKPNKISQFWNELKRRNVHRSLAIYAGSAFVFLEAATIIFPRWGFPDWTIDLALYLIILGAVITLVVAWIFDITPEGVQKTKPAAEIGDSEKQTGSNAWKLATYISLVVIVALIVFNVITSTKTVKAGDIQSLVVLPFDNYTGDDQLENMVSGMHALLVGDIGRISGIRVLGKTTSNVYKDVDISATGIASELNVDAVLEASVMCFGDTVCMQFRLVGTTGEEEQLWIGDYKVDKSQIPNLFNKITKQVADEIMIELTPEEERLFIKSRTVDREAYDAYVRSYQYWDDLSQESLYKALEYLNLAVEKDPNWAPLYAALAQVWVGLAQAGFTAPDVAGPKIFKNLNKAIELDPDFPDAHFISGIIAVWQEWDWEKGEREFLKALEINPNDVMSRIYYSHLLMILKRYDEALFHSQMAVELDPMNPLVLGLSANVDYRDRIQQALKKSKKALEIDTEHHLVLLVFKDASYHNGDYKNSIVMELKIRPGLDDEARKAIMAAFKEKGYTAALETMLTYMEEYARTNNTGYFEMGKYYYRAGNLDKTIECYIKAYEMHDPMMPYITISEVGFDEIKDDPRIISIVEKMNFPLTIFD